MANNWIDVSALQDVPEEDVTGVEADGRDIALYSVEGQVYATANICTHGHARLCDGFLDGFEIECPLHQGKFDIRDGRPTCEPVTEPVRSYPVKIEGGRVFVDLGA
ncbi:non-heme iron oxygenase ferredoxin subunit [Noviherbaspirillum pedocola]|uniref:Non-heme iron oxygenase ferredoxin subunit n=1 Tax=Noviherbaspirillum pedocola TaxID=2801341 RepID=A0A934W7R5_9BURK|nr:non-heme iron oxygenase ferredoxin subunit [Noviherbaspirillum pedocola]MBK4734979.1 non-heme iron oxygenase ferredoxin subunit [Noviherbaspirillum pedocola]